MPLTLPTAGLVLGIALLITFAISIGAIVQRNYITIGLVILNWTLIIDALGIVIIGTFVWFMTLRERDNFHHVYALQTPQTRIAIQDKVRSRLYHSRLVLLTRYSPIAQMLWLLQL
jgi:hypothetical protein